MIYRDKFFHLLFCILTAVFCVASTVALHAEEADIAKLRNPIDRSYLQKNLKQSKPRLIYTETSLAKLKEAIETDPVARNLYQAIRLEAMELLDRPVIEHKQTSNAILDISRGFLRRINMLGLVYLLERDPTILDRINRELLAVANFSDWNPQVFLDTATISMGVALALDWTLDDLPPETIRLAKEALTEKAINPSWEKNGEETNYNWWINHPNNWNQVCNGGLIAASISVADVSPELAARTIHRALDGIPYVLDENYAPDGVCPEGVMYWNYTTSYALLTLSILESALNDDFGYRDYPGFMKSAMFKVMTSHLPTGGYYNYADCNDGPSTDGDIELAWFGAETGKKMFFEKEAFLTPAEEIRISSLTPAAMAWIIRYREHYSEKPPTAYVGLGRSPVAVFRDRAGPDGFFLGAKGGCGAVSHGNMDAGSFLFELDGVRWSVDPGIRGYMIGEQGFDLWSQHQEAQRWELLNQNNHGHSTITVDGQRHVVDGYARVIDHQLGEQPSVTFDLSPTFHGQLRSARRQLTRTGPRSFDIRDTLVPGEETKTITWQFITRAEIEMVQDGAVLRQDGKSLHIHNFSHPQLSFRVVSLDPPPHPLDKHIDDLKRLELNIPVKPDGAPTKIHIALGD
jgi:hypothetical protein